MEVYILQEVPDDLPQLEASNQSIPNNVMDVVGGSDLSRLDMATGDSNFNLGHGSLKDDGFNQGTDAATLTLDYKANFENSRPVDMPPTDIDVDTDKRPQDYQQSYDEAEMVDNAASGNNALVQKQELSSNQLQDEGYAVGGCVIPPGQSNESPIPSDGLHHKQPGVDEQVASPSHQFASPNSAFESRIRSMSISSTNSNSSSQKSASGLSGRSAQNRSFSQLGAAAVELNNTSKAEATPAPGPFSKFCMLFIVSVCSR